MRWRKLGLVRTGGVAVSWAESHAMVPIPIRLNEQVIRVYATFLDANNIGRPGYIDVDANDPTTVLSVSQSPLLEIGEPGSFDENGILACSIVDVGGGRLHMYYVGFELGTKIRYRLLTGLAISKDGGKSFSRYSTVPVLERSSTELFFRGGPYCAVADQGFEMWYVAGSSWEVINGKSMPVYDIRHITSKDGINWPEKGEVVIPVTEPDEHGFGRPYVIANPNGGYRMFYSVRRRSLSAYRLGYAESPDGRQWTRKDHELNLDVSDDGFDSHAIMYATPLYIEGKLHLFYNGNDFGREGFGVAVLEEE